MHLPPLLPYGLLLFALHTAHAATFDLGNNWTLNVDIPTSWTTTGQPLDDHGYDLCFQPPSDEGPQIRFTIIVPPDGKALDRTQADTTFREVAAEYAKDSLEKEADIKEVNLTDGFAFYASFTDASLVGQAPVPGAWKTSTPCVMVLSGKVVISATIFSDDLATADFAASLAMLQSARLAPPT